MNRARTLRFAQTPPFSAESGSRALRRDLTIAIALSDVMAVSLGLVGGQILTFAELDIPTFLLTAGLWLSVFFAFGLYGVDTLPAWDELRRIIGATVIGIVVLETVTALSPDPLPRSRLAASCGLVLLAELIDRRLWRRVAWRLKQRGLLIRRTLIVGTNADAAALATSLRSQAHGYAPVGHVMVSPDDALDAETNIAGDLWDLEQLIRQYDARCVFVASGAASGETLLRVARACRHANIEMRLSANLPELLASRMSIDPIGNMLAISVRPLRLSRVQSVAKRVFDVVVASIAFVLVLPVMAVIWIAIRLTSKGPALFRQERVSRDFVTFRMHKFRTMTFDADASDEGRRLNLDALFFKLEDDPRVTKLGRFLRRYSLDELPQLWNVIRGEMTLVGPRPLRVEQVTANETLLGNRHEVKTGMTGWWQIHGRNDVGGIDAVKMDIFYIENWSLALDIYILLKTMGTVLARHGAY